MYKQTSLEHVDNRKYKPLIKWAGGKTRLNSLLLQTADLALESLNVKKFNYYEDASLHLVDALERLCAVVRKILCCVILQH